MGNSRAAKMLDEYEKYVAELSVQWREYESTPIDKSEEALSNEVDQGLASLTRFFREICKEAKAGNFSKATATLSQDGTKEFKIASIPLSVFYHDKTDNKVLRFCFAKSEDTLNKASEILCRI